MLPTSYLYSSRESERGPRRPHPRAQNRPARDGYARPHWGGQTGYGFRRGRNLPYGDMSCLNGWPQCPRVKQNAATSAEWGCRTDQRRLSPDSLRDRTHFTIAGGCVIRIFTGPGVSVAADSAARDSAILRTSA